MKADEKRFYEVEAYLKGQLSPADRSSFEAEMAADTALAEQVAFQKWQQKADELLIEEDLRERIRGWKKDLDRAPLEAKTIRLRWLGVISVAAGLFLFTYFLFLKPNEVLQTPATTPLPELPVVKNESPVESLQVTPSAQENRDENEKLEPAQSPNFKEKVSSKKYYALAQSFGKEPVYASENLRGKDENKQFVEATDSLLQKKYPKAIAYLLAIKNDEIHYLDAQYNIGCAYYAQKKYAEAIPFFEKTAIHDTYLYGDAAKWYLILSYLGVGNVGKAKEWITKLLMYPDGDFYHDAKKLERSLRDK
jgi:tetratricopeptide (TPR) repeat protein